MNTHQMLATGGALLLAIAIDFRKYWRAKKQNPNVKFDLIEAALTALIGLGGGGAISVAIGQSN